MTQTSVSTHTFTIVHTATHLADVILGSIADILGTLGIDVTRLFGDWAQDQQAIAAWTRERSLACVILECHQPDGTVSPVFEFPVAYKSGGEGDTQFTADRASLARYLAKLRAVPKGTRYSLFCSFNGAHSPQPGWNPGSRALTNGMQMRSFGTLTSSPHASATMRYYTK